MSLCHLPQSQTETAGLGMRPVANNVPREPLIAITSSVIGVSSAIQIQGAARVALYTIFKVRPKLRNDFRGQKVTVHMVYYTEESDKPRSDVRGFTVVFLSRLSWVFFVWTAYIRPDQDLSL